jgi:hypothetical protein
MYCSREFAFAIASESADLRENLILMIISHISIYCEQFEYLNAGLRISGKYAFDAPFSAPGAP